MAGNCYVCLAPVTERGRGAREPVACTTCNVSVHAGCLAQMRASALDGVGARLDLPLRCGHCRTPHYPCVKRTHAAGKTEFASSSPIVMYMFWHHLRMYDFYFRLLCTEHDALQTVKSLLRPGAASYTRRLAAAEAQEYTCDVLADRLGLGDSDMFGAMRADMLAQEDTLERI